MIQRTQGVSLIELLFVFVIAIAIMMLGIRQYQSYRFDASMSQIKSNVDLLAQSAARYFYANCSESLDPNTNKPIAKPFYVNKPLASLSFPDLSNGAKGVSISKQTLIDSGNLPANELIAIPQVNDYVIQMNLMQQDRMVCMTSNCFTTNGEKRKIGTINQWTIQIGINLVDTKQTESYSHLLAATCVSHLVSGGGPSTLVEPCTNLAPTKDDDYIVFQRSPSFATEKMFSGMEQINPTLQQFQQMYTTQPITRLVNEPELVKTQFFNCAG